MQQERLAIADRFSQTPRTTILDPERKPKRNMSIVLMIALVLISAIAIGVAVANIDPI